MCDVSELTSVLQTMILVNISNTLFFLTFSLYAPVNFDKWVYGLNPLILNKKNKGIL